MPQIELGIVNNHAIRRNEQLFYALPNFRKFRTFPQIFIRYSVNIPAEMTHIINGLMGFYQIFPAFKHAAVFKQSQPNSTNTARTIVCSFKIQSAKFHIVSPIIIHK